METSDQIGRTGPRPAIVWATVGALAFATRFPTLGLQSPWLDEINNWLTATVAGPRIELRAHTLSYFSEWLGLALSDSTWGLRLYSAVIGFVAVVALTQFLLSRVGARAALIGGSLFALLPFSIHYSQDANHYAAMMLSGILAAFAVGWFLDRPDAKPAMAAAALVACAILVGYHPVGLLPLVGGGACLFIWMVVYADRVPPKALAPTAKRAGLVVLAVIALAVFLSLEAVRRHINLGQFAQVAGTRSPGFTWSFWSPLLADLLSTPFVHSGADVLIGVVGALLAVGGWAWAWRAGLRWATVGAALVAVLTVVPFIAFELGHFFYPKFYAAVVPLLVCGIALAAEGAFRAKGGARTVGLAVVGLWAVVLVAHSVPWHAARIELNHQPTYQVLAAIRAQSPDGTVVATKNNYSSRAFGFLWNRAAMGGRRHVALTASEQVGAPAIQQLEELAFESDKPVLFTSLLESREHYAEDFAAFLKNQTRVLAYYPSSAPDDFVPFDRGITMRAVEPPARDPFLLPRAGERMSTVLDEFRARPVWGDRGAAFSLPLATGARYRFRVEETAPGLALDYRWDVAGARPDVMLIAVDGERVFAVECEGLAAAGAVRVPTEIAPGGLHTFDIMMVNRNQDWTSARPAGVIPSRLRVATGMDTDVAPEATFLGAEERPEVVRETLPPGVRRLELPVSGLALAPVAAGDTVIAIAPFEVGGLPYLGAAPVIDLAGQRVGLWSVLGWTQGQSMVGAIFEAKAPAAKADILMYIRPKLHGEEHDPWYARGAVRMYRLGGIPAGS